MGQDEPPSGRVIGFGILGTGAIANYHRDAIRANHGVGAQLVAVAAHRRERRAEASRTFGVPCVTESALLENPKVDVICICTPSGLHASQAVRAAEAGKNVLIEKPIALSLDDADAVIEAASACGVTIGVALQRRAVAAFQTVADAIARGTFGRLTLGTITMPYHRPQRYYDQAGWRGTRAMDGGVLMNQGIHLVDLLIWYLGDPVSAHAVAATLELEIEVEDTIVAALRFGSGALATVSATTTTDPSAQHRLELYGTRGYVQVEGEAIIAWKGEGTRPSFDSSAHPPLRGATSSLGRLASDGHIAIVRNFVDALNRGRSPLVDAREARRSLAAVLAIYRAARWTK